MNASRQGAGGPLTLPMQDGHAADAETLLMLYGLVRYAKPALIVEAGTYMGHAACTMALALKDGQIDGEVWSADVKDYGAAKSVTANGLDEWVHLYQGDFGAMLDGPLAGRLCRMAFIDSGLVVGEDTTVVVDLRVNHVRLASQRLTPGGVMVIDDCGSEWTGRNEIKEMASLYLPKGRGMVIVQRP